MAGTGIGLFLPSETAYKDPNRFRDILEAEGNKEAKYLAEMDQFFLQLDETKREFDLTLAQKNTFFEEQLAFEKGKLSWQSGENALDRGLSREQIASQEKLGFAQIASADRRTDAATSANSQSDYYKQQELNMAKEKNAFYKSIFEAKERRVEDSYNIAKSGYLSGSTSGISGMNSSGFNPLSRNADGSYIDYSGTKEDTYDYGAYNDWNL